ncbi:hypothetical protein NHQ30_006550 [Ciborinia camelliae]|nr:hypothetical protein NHQ30_006550 [Ciborinia camelliae]
MQSLNRILENIRSHVDVSRGQATAKDNRANTAGPLFEGETQEQTSTPFNDTKSSEGTISEETDTPYSTPQESWHHTSRDNTQVTEESYTSSSTSNSTTTTHRFQNTRASSASRPSSPFPFSFQDENGDGDDHIEPPTALSMSGGPSIPMPIRQEETHPRGESTNSLRHQWMNNGRRINTHVLSNNRDSARIETLYANGQSPLNHIIEPIPELTEAAIPYRQQIGGIIVFHPDNLPHDRPHHHVRVHGGMFLNEVPNDPDFEDDAMTTAIERALIPTADTENDSCVVCQDQYDNGEHQSVKVPGCAHIFGKACIMRWLNDTNAEIMTCPMCRNHIEILPVRPSTPFA